MNLPKSGAIINSTVTPACLSATQSTVPALEACVPAQTTFTPGSLSTFLDSICTPNCQSAINAFKPTSQTCGNQLIFQNDNTTTASAFLSEFLIASAVGCVKDTTASGWCLVNQLNTLSANGVDLTSSNALNEGIVYTVKNNAFACSTCVGKEFDGLNGIDQSLIDPSVKPQFASFQSQVKIICPNGFAVQSSKNSAFTASDSIWGLIGSLLFI